MTIVDGTGKIVKEKIKDFDFKIKNNGTGVPTEIDYGDLKEPSLSEVLMAGFKEEQAASKNEEEEKTLFQACNLRFQERYNKGN